MYHDYILSADVELVREIQGYCADLADSETIKVAPDGDTARWNGDDAAHCAAILNRSDNPVSLFRFIDEKTGSSSVGYRTRDDREWFHILRQMRNTPGSGLLENLRYD